MDKYEAFLFTFDLQTPSEQKVAKLKLDRGISGYKSVITSLIYLRAERLESLQWLERYRDKL